ncbi:MAG: HAD-IC family P-type ATPase [Methanomassiliicoccales archaeon]
MAKLFNKKRKESLGEEEGRAVEWHALTSEEVLERIGSQLDGLTQIEVENRRRKFGKNLLPTKKPPTIFEVFLRQFLSPLIYVLLAAGLVSVLIGDVKDAIFISVVLLINAIIGTFQEIKAERSAEQLQKLLQTTARVKREGREMLVKAEELVPGDIVLLESGSRVPADLRLISHQNLSVDESLLTGESLPVEKGIGALPKDTVLSDRRNMAFAGTTVSRGRGMGVVVQTGGRTEIGNIAKAVSMVDDAKPPLLIRLEKFSKQISYIILFAALGLGIVALLRGFQPLDVFFLAVALAVSAIPEGLPVAVTVAMAVRVTRMAKRNVLTRRLAAVESLGSCTCIASDKTGTLTVNRQTARLVCIGPGEHYFVSGEGYDGEGHVVHEDGSEISLEEKARLLRIAKSAVICNEGSLEKVEGRWVFAGDSVDVALLALGYKLGLDVSSLGRSLSIKGEIPFESEKRFAAKFYVDDGRTMVAVKGAVEAVTHFCSNMLCGGALQPLDEAKVRMEADYLSGNGYRVLAVAEGEIDPSTEFGEAQLKGLTFLGVIGMIDPPRPEVREAVAKCKSAGIKVIMITGDHPSTALAIAKELGIASSKEEVVTGKELAEIGTSDTSAYLERVKVSKVFARVTPMQKVEIVDALIRLGNFVAVTGDGVNDAPALRKANIGVAMGSGTDVAKDAASIIITDDNFASIVAGVEEGRYAYDNVRKVTYLLVSTGMAEITLFVLALFFGAVDDATGTLILPLLAVQLLWLNVVTNGIQHVTLAMEGGEPEAMQRPPRDPKEGIFDTLMKRQVAISAIFMGALAFLVYYYLGEYAGYSPFQATNMTLLFMVFLENVHVFNCRSERKSVFKVPFSRNYFLVLGVLGAQGVHILAMYTPVLQEVLRVEPVSLWEYVAMLLLALSLLAVMEVYKYWLRSNEAKAHRGKELT